MIANEAAAQLFRVPASTAKVSSGPTAGVPSRSEIVDWASVVEELSYSSEVFAAAANQIEVTADTHVQQMLTPGGTDWEGDAAHAAQQQAYSDRGVVYEAADLLRRMRKVASLGGGSIQQCRNLALDAIAQAEADGFCVESDLTVTDSQRYTAQQACVYEARRAMAATHHSYIVMRAGGLVSEDVRVGSELSAGAAELSAMVPPAWLQDQTSIRQASNDEGDVQAYDTDSQDKDASSGEQIAERLRELRKGLNRGVSEVDSEEEIFDLYEELARGGTPLPTPDNYYDRRVLPDGTIIGVRESNDHGPTLDVSYPPGVSGPDKVHLPPGPPAPPPPTPPTPGEAPVIASPPDLPVIDHPPVPGLIPPWAQTPSGVPQGPFDLRELPPGVGIATPEPSPVTPPAGLAPDWGPHASVPTPTPDEQVGIGTLLFGGLLAFLGWLGTPKVTY
ncbi:hypothetical protein FHR72_001134 [Mycolicibacterium iranicum]|uniref:Uncharacterized protein n=1 Tax=Mycolicibacterium iranicum TaxID=912594 RepID=A0A839QAU3_MYCIR|nr:hypothetical protein [Mycolicibacterium iranicum]MBB2989671.1 hypothetical protein [Mycolicibacterium iranicum]